MRYTSIVKFTTREPGEVRRITKHLRALGAGVVLEAHGTWIDRADGEPLSLNGSYCRVRVAGRKWFYVLAGDEHFTCRPEDGFIRIVAEFVL